MAFRMNKFRYQAPAEDGSDVGGSGDETGDRGDDFVPTEDEDGNPIVAKTKDPVKDDKADADAAALQKDIDDKAAADKEAADKAEAEKTATADGKPKGKGVIPVDRHESILAKERERREQAEARAAALEGNQRTAKLTTDLSAKETALENLEGEYTKLVVDGDAKGAAAIMKQIRTGEREINDINAQARDEVFQAQTVAKASYDTALVRVESAYPELNEDHDDFSPDMMKRVSRFMAANRQSGMSPVDALKDAVLFVMGAPKTAGQTKATNSEPAAKDDGKERDTAARKKVADAVAATPAATKDLGMNSDKAGGGALDAQAVMKLSQGKFAELSDATLSELRGDKL
jgi:hypothetical protein